MIPTLRTASDRFYRATEAEYSHRGLLHLALSAAVVIACICLGITLIGFGD